jgi:hypothetical protein
MRQAVDQHRRIVDLTVTGRLGDASTELVSHMKTVQRLAMEMVGGEEKALQSRRSRKVKA